MLAVVLLTLRQMKKISKRGTTIIIVIMMKLMIVIKLEYQKEMFKNRLRLLTKFKKYDVLTGNFVAS